MREKLFNKQLTSYIFLKVRNRPLESLLDTLKVTCPHRESGCVEKVAVKLLKRHSENCIYK